MSPTSPLRVTRACDAPRDTPPAAGGAADPAIDPGPLLGTWVSFDQATRGLVRVVVGSTADGRLTVRAFGADRPAARDWGEVPGDAYTSSVQLERTGQARPYTPGAPAGVGFTARYAFGFVDTLLAAYLNRRLLVVDTYNVFRDGSGRASYFTRDHFYQAAGSAAAGRA